MNKLSLVREAIELLAKQERVKEYNMAASGRAAYTRRNDEFLT